MYINRLPVLKLKCLVHSSTIETTLGFGIILDHLLAVH